MMSNHEEDDDDHDLDDGQQGDPQQEERDQGVLGGLRHRQAGGRARGRRTFSS